MKKERDDNITAARSGIAALIPHALRNVADAIVAGDVRASLAVLWGTGVLERFQTTLTYNAPTPLDTVNEVTHATN